MNRYQNLKQAWYNEINEKFKASNTRVECMMLKKFKAMHEVKQS
jgi:hypothetical protein